MVGPIYNSNTSNTLNLGPPLVGTTTTITSTSVDSWYARRELCLEHTTGDGFEFSDGTLIATCINCGVHIRVQRVPGGIHLPKIIHLLQQLAAKEATDELVAEYAVMRQVLQAEREAIELAESMLQPIDMLIAQRLLD